MNTIVKDIKVFILCCLAGLACAFIFFQLPLWDFYSYHYYNGWAFLNNRMDIDFMPCMFRTYFNPILDVIIYFTISKLNEYPLIFTAVSSLKFSVLIFLSYKLYHFLFYKFDIKDKFSIPLCLISAGLSPIIICCSFSLGYTDIHIAILTMIGFYIYLKNIFNRNKNSLFYILTASFFIGLAFGLKYTNISFVIAIFLTTLCLYKKINNPIKTLIYISLGLMAGFLIADGFWMIRLYQKFQNPLFPYFNNIFKSPLADYNSVISSDFNHLLPKNILEFIFHPFKGLYTKRFIGFEYKYFDLKIPLAFLIVLYLFIYLKSKHGKTTLTSEKTNLLYLILFFTVFSYYSNIALFANIRYIIPLFILIPAMICITLSFIFKNKKVYSIVFLLILAIICSTYRYGFHLKKWSPSNQIIKIIDVNFKDNSAVLGTFLTCFIAPAQNPTVKYIGYSLQKDIAQRGYWQKWFKNKYFTNTSNEKIITETIKKHEHVYFAYSLLDNRRDMHLYQESLTRYFKRKISFNNCRTVWYAVYNTTNPERKIKVCKIK